MAGEEDGDDVIVSLPGDMTEVKVIKAGEAEIKKTPPAGDVDPVEDLKGQFAAMTSRVAAAETAAQTAARQLEETNQRLHAAQGDVVSSQLDTVLSGIAAAQAEAAAAEQAYVAAAEAGDFPAQARAQRAMAGAESRIQRLAEAKDDLEDAVKRRPAPGDQQRQQPSQQRQQPPADPIERFTQGMSARSAAFIKKNPQTVTDPKMNARMLAAHNLALADDVEVDSDEYFRRIEDGIKPAQQQQQRPTPSGDGRRPSSAAAPASGGSGGLNGGGVEVRLTKREAASATDGTLIFNYDDPTGQNRWKKGDPIGLAEMARRKHEGMKNGLYDKSVSE